MAEFKKYVLRFDESGFNNSLQTEKLKIPFYKGIVDLYNALGIENKLSENDMFPMFENPRDFLIDKIFAGEPFKIGGIAIAKDKIFDFIDSPEKYLDFINTVNSKINTFYSNQNVNWTGTHADFFIKNGKEVVFSKEAEERIKNSFTLFIENEHQDKVYNKLKELVSVANDLKKLKKSNWLDLDFIYEVTKRKTPLVHDSAERQDLEVNLEAIKNF